MLLYAAKIMRDPRMGNPTLVFLTDRNDLDDQLFGEVFAPARDPAREAGPGRLARRPAQLLLRARRAASSSRPCRSSRPRQGGDANPVLTDRRNVVVVADEAHRSQYGFAETLDADGTLKAGLAKHMRDALPGATYLGFTGTPIESTDKSTRAVFGDYIDVYDLTRAVEDGATVKIFYESRLAKVALSDDDYEALDELADEITEERRGGRGDAGQVQVGPPGGHRRRRGAARPGRRRHRRALGEAPRGDARQGHDRRRCRRRIAVRLYEKIVALRPDWHTDDPTAGKIKVVMTGSAADPPEFQPHLHSKDVRKELKARAKDPDDPLELVIVRDMWLTGFDAPSMHTMYVDKTMQGAGLMQAIARVNRTFRDKPGGLIVDYIGVFANLQKALVEYSPTDRDQAGVPIEEMVAAMLEKHDIVRGLLHGCAFDSSPDLPAGQRLAEHAKVLDFVMADPDRTDALPRPGARARQGLRAVRRPRRGGGDPQRRAPVRRRPRRHPQDPEPRLRPRRSRAPSRSTPPSASSSTRRSPPTRSSTSTSSPASRRPSCRSSPTSSSTRSRDKDKPNLQMGLLRRLLNDQIRTVQRTNLVQARKFSEQLEEAINRYTNRSLTTAEIIAELVKLAKEMRDQAKRHEQLGLSVAEAAFYDAIVQNDAAVLQMGDDTLKKIAVDLVWSVRSSVTIDWNLKESVGRRMRSKVRRLLAKYDYPPDLEEKADRAGPRAGRALRGLRHRLTDARAASGTIGAEYIRVGRTAVEDGARDAELERPDHLHQPGAGGGLQSRPTAVRAARQVIIDDRVAVLEALQTDVGSHALVDVEGRPCLTGGAFASDRAGGASGTTRRMGRRRKGNRPPGHSEEEVSTRNGTTGWSPMGGASAWCSSG